MNNFRYFLLWNRKSKGFSANFYSQKGYCFAGAFHFFIGNLVAQQAQKSNEKKSSFNALLCIFTDDEVIVEVDNNIMISIITSYS